MKGIWKGDTGDGIGDDRSSKGVGVTIDVIDLSYSVLVDKTIKILLRNVNFTIQAGEMCALMGPSGAGKSTLLDLIADRKLDGRWSGEVYFDNKRRSKYFGKDSAYVLQDDIHIATLTVQETIYYSAWTRLPEGTSKEFIQRRVQLLLSITGLTHVKDMVVGSGMQRGISGGQLKRLSIAVEIVALPNLIFLDEPTSGLDSTIALEVMSAVRMLADQNRTCVSTIHQPSPEVFSLFDKVVLLSDGRLIFSGRTEDAIKYFTGPVTQISVGASGDQFSLPAANNLGNIYYFLEPYKNSADLIIEVSGGQVLPVSGANGEAISAEQLELRYYRSEFYSKELTQRNSKTFDSKPDITELDNASKSNIELFFASLFGKRVHLHSTGKLTQFAMLMHRSWTALIRDTEEIRSQLLKSLSVGLLVGIVFWAQAVDPEPLYTNGLLNSTVSNITSILFFGMMYTLISNMQSIPYLCGQNKLYRREMASNTYSAAPYWLSQSIVVIPTLVVNQFIYGMLCFYMCGFKNTAEFFFYFQINMFFCNLSSYYFAMFLAALVNSEQMALALFPLFYMFLLTFAGYSISVNDVPPFWIWAPYISYARWAFEGLMVNQFEGFPTDDNPMTIEGNGNVLAYYDFENFNKWDSLWMLTLYVAALTLTTYGSLRPLRSTLLKVQDVEIMDNGESGSICSVNKYQAVATDNNGVFHQGVSPIHAATDNQERNSATETNQADQVQENSSHSLSSTSLNADWFKSSTGETPLSAGCQVLFRNVSYDVMSVALPSKQWASLRPRSSSESGPKKALTGELVDESMGESDTSTANKTIRLLHSVYGEAKAGEMVALMGSSGAGKSTLLDILAGRKTTGDISGQILFNGAERSEAVMKKSAYVMQDNVHIGVLTVRETLYFAAELRLDEKWNRDRKDQRIEKVLAMLGLQEVQNTIIGTNLKRGISGGQLKRLSIGVEIIHLPDILFLDEPTTGLDSALAFEVMSSIKNLANQNRTILCTIHQPSPQTFALFNQLLLLSSGRVVYFGPVNDVVEYFSSSPLLFTYHTGQNPADYVVNVASICSSSKKEIESVPINDNHGDVESPLITTTLDKGKSNQLNGCTDLAQHFLASKNYTKFEESFDSAISTMQKTEVNSLSRWKFSKKPAHGESADDKAAAKSMSMSQYTSVANQVKVLCYRSVVVTRKNAAVVIVTFFRHILVGLFYGTIYFHLAKGTSQNAYSNRLCLFFFSSVFLIAGHQSAIPQIHHNRLVFYRERGSRAYGAFAYWISNWIVEVPLITLNVLAFGVILHYLSALRDTPQAMIVFLFILWITSVIGLFICHVVAAISSSSQSAVSIYPIFLFFSVAFAGFIIKLPDFPSWMGSWAPYISFLRYGVQALTLNEFEGNDQLPFSETFIDSLGYSNFNLSQCLGLEILFIGVFGILFLWALEYISFEVR